MEIKHSYTFKKIQKKQKVNKQLKDKKEGKEKEGGRREGGRREGRGGGGEEEGGGGVLGVDCGGAHLSSSTQDNEGG